MSVPISMCMFSKALKDEEVLASLRERLQYNVKRGSMLLLPCKHDPPCKPPSEEEMEELVKKLLESDKKL